MFWCGSPYSLILLGHCDLDGEIQTEQHPNVEITVRNFGPIAEAAIDLRPLTVFIGPSNWKLRILDWLSKLFPVTMYVEDIKARTLKR